MAALPLVHVAGMLLFSSAVLFEELSGSLRTQRVGVELHSESSPDFFHDLRRDLSAMAKDDAPRAQAGRREKEHQEMLLDHVLRQLGEEAAMHLQLGDVDRSRAQDARGSAFCADLFSGLHSLENLVDLRRPDQIELHQDVQDAAAKRFLIVQRRLELPLGKDLLLQKEGRDLGLVEAAFPLRYRHWGAPTFTLRSVHPRLPYPGTSAP